MCEKIGGCGPNPQQLNNLNQFPDSPGSSPGASQVGSSSGTPFGGGWQNLSPEQRQQKREARISSVAAATGLSPDQVRGAMHGPGRAQLKSLIMQRAQASGQSPEAAAQLADKLMPQHRHGGNQLGMTGPGQQPFQQSAFVG